MCLRVFFSGVLLASGVSAGELARVGDASSGGGGGVRRGHTGTDSVVQVFFLKKRTISAILPPKHQVVGRGPTSVGAFATAPRLTELVMGRVRDRQESEYQDTRFRHEKKIFDCSDCCSKGCSFTLIVLHLQVRPLPELFL